MAAVIKPYGYDFGWSTWRQELKVVKFMIVVGSLEVLIGSAGDALNHFIIPYSVFSLLAEGVANNFHLTAKFKAISHRFQVAMCTRAGNCLVVFSVI